LPRQLLNSKLTNWSYHTLIQQRGNYAPDYSDVFYRGIQTSKLGLKNEPDVMLEFPIGLKVEKISEIIKDVPLPTATWLFLGVLLGFLRIQRRKAFN
jgi:hypothetical protein